MSESDNPTVSRLLKDMDAHFGLTQPTLPQEKKTFAWESKTVPLSDLERKQALEVIWERDEKKCHDCGRADDLTLNHERTWKEGGKKRYDNHLDKMNCLCRSCNSKHQYRRNGLPDLLPPKREKASPINDATYLLHRRVDYQAGTPPMQVNDLCEIPWLKGIFAWLKKHGRLTKHDALNRLAKEVGWSNQASRKAYDKHVFIEQKSSLTVEDAKEEYALVEQIDAESHVKYVKLNEGWKLEELGDGTGLWPKPSLDIPQAFTVSEGTA